MGKIRTGVIGCGKVGHMHAKAFMDIANAEFVAACDFDMSRAQSYADQYGTKAFTSVTSMVRDAKIDVVSICTPHPMHRAAAIEALDAGANVLVEKPLASTLADCDAMINLARQKGLILGTVCQRRFYRPSIRIREAIDAGKLGKPVLGLVTMLGWRDEAYYRSDPWRGTWRDEGGGVLVNQAPHQLDMLQWYMGPIEELYGFWANLNHPYIEVEDTAVAVIRFKSGALGNIVVSNSQNPALYGKVQIFGGNGAAVGVQTDGGAMFIAGMSNITEPPLNDLWTVPGEERLLEQWKQEDIEHFKQIDFIHHYHKRQLEDFISAVSAGKEPLINGEQGRKTVEIFTALYRSNRDKKPVTFPLAPDVSDGRY